MILRGWSFAFAVFALILSALLIAHAAKNDEMARSDFNWGAEDWELFGPGKLKLYERGGMLYGSDNGKTVWYFSAPETFLGEKAFAHNGRLSFRLGHSEYMSNGKDMIKDWDVILESKEWRIRVGVKNLIPPWVGATTNELSLNEKSWTVMKGQGHGHSPTTIQMLRLLSSLSAVYIRGGYYDGHEETWIDSVLLQEGDHQQDQMLRKVAKHHHEPLKKKRELEAEKRKQEEREMLIAAGQMTEDGEPIPLEQAHQQAQLPPSATRANDVERQKQLEEEYERKQREDALKAEATAREEVKRRREEEQVRAQEAEKAGLREAEEQRKRLAEAGRATRQQKRQEEEQIAMQDGEELVPGEEGEGFIEGMDPNTLREAEEARKRRIAELKEEEERKRKEAEAEAKRIQEEARRIQEAIEQAERQEARVRQEEERRKQVAEEERKRQIEEDKRLAQEAERAREAAAARGRAEAEEEKKRDRKSVV